VLLEIIDVKGDINTYVSDFLNNFKNKMPIYRKITVAACRSTLFEKLNQKFDGAYASLVLANTEYDTSTSLYYLSAPINKIAKDYSDCIKSLGFEYRQELRYHSNNDFTGSKLSIDIEKVGAIFSSRRKQLLTFINQKELSFEDIKTRFNLFSCYTVLVLLAGTAHRPRTEFSFTKFTMDKISGNILLSDKVHHLESACRLVPICDILKNQLNSYENFVKQTARLLKSKNVDLAENLSLISSEYDHGKPYFCLINDDNSLKAIGNADLNIYLKPEMNLPLNFFRHYFSSQMRADGQFKYLKSILGHVGSEEHILSKYSCSSSSDLKFLSPLINKLVEKINLLPIIVTPIKGSIVKTTKPDSFESYIPSSLLQENIKTSIKSKLSWFRTIIEPEIKNLKNEKLREETIKRLEQTVISSTDSGIEINERLYFLNRYINKIHKTNRWTGLKNSQEDINISYDFIHKIRQKRIIFQLIFDWINKDNDLSSNNNIIFIKIWLSLVIHSKMNVPFQKKNILQILKRPFIANGICFFELIGHDREPIRVIVDSYTTLLLQKNASYKTASTNIANLKRTFKSLINQILSRPLLKRELLDDKLQQADLLSNFINSSQDDISSSLTYSYQNNKINTTCLSSEKLTRWLSKTPLNINNENEITESNEFIQTYNEKVVKNPEYKYSLNLIKKLQTELNLQKISTSTKITRKKILIKTWAEHIDCKNETNIDILIQKSLKLEDVVIAVIVWLIEVSIKPGRGKRKLTALGTIQTYLSLVGKPLLEHAHGIQFYLLDTYEYEFIFNQTLDSRTRKSRVQRAGVFRNFYNFIQNRFDTSPVDWFKIEPNINKKYLGSDANIFSMREYRATLELLSNDTDFDQYNKRINQIILIFCYRAGLRTGEICFLHIGDIDTVDWIVHVKSTHLHRLKTIMSNRRVPIGLFLSDSEKNLIKEHIQVVKSYYREEKSTWLFSDKTNAYCFKSLQLNLERVREALKKSSGDNSLKLKHGRHSFASYLLLLMNPSFYPTAVNDELKEWAGTDDLKSYANSLQHLLVGNTVEKEKFVYAISSIMGHVSPVTTFSSYIHTVDIFLSSENEQCIYNKISMIDFTKLSDFSVNNGYQIIKRQRIKNNTFGYQALTERTIKTGTEFRDFNISNKINDVQLSSLKVKPSIQIVREFNDIERIVRLKENEFDLLAIAKKLYLDYSFVDEVIKSTLLIKEKTGYKGINLNSNSKHILFETNIKNHGTYIKFINQNAFQQLIHKLAEQNLNDSAIKTVSDLWLEHYTKKGLLVDEHEISELIIFLAKLNYKTHINHEYSMRTNFGKRKGKLLKLFPDNNASLPRKNTDNRIQHLLFLLTVWIQINCTSHKEAA